MPAGLTVLGDHGLYQIDDTSYVMGVIAHGNLSSLTYVSSGSEGVDCPVYRLTTTVAQPIFGLYLPYATNYIGGVRTTTLSSGTWTCDFQLWGRLGVSRTLTNAKYFVFGRMPSQGSSGLGLEVYDTSGGIVFNSAQKMRTIAGAAGTTLDGAKRYAVIGSTVGWSDHLDVDYVTTDVWTHHQWHVGYGFTTGLGGVYADNTVIYDSVGFGSGGGGYEQFYYGVDQIAQSIDVTDLTS